MQHRSPSFLLLSHSLFFSFSHRMGSLNISPELSLDFRPIFIPKTITMFLEQVSKIGSLREKVLQVDHFVNQLECETRKIEAFKHELPLSMLVINDAIAALKEESMVLKKSSYVEPPVLEEFIPIKKSCDDDDDIQIEVIGDHKEDNGDKKNWLSSTHLWNTNENHDHEPNSSAQTIKKRNEKEDASRAIFSPEINNQMRGRGSGLFAEVNGNNSRLIPFSPPNVQPADIQIRASHIVHAPSQHQTSSRKQRRSWSIELHRLFVNALQQLGGSQVATPKQIREVMQVDDLTNDEVKSHLQKYRLHTRRHSSSNTSDQNVGSSKFSNSQSGSPDGPLPNGGSNMDDEDDKSENNWWNGHV